MGNYHNPLFPRLGKGRFARLRIDRNHTDGVNILFYQCFNYLDLLSGIRL